MIQGGDLARELGISPTALSQIVNGKGRYSAATRERVLERIKATGYAPHAGARAARLRRFDTVAVFSTSAGAAWKLPPPLMDGLMAGARGLDQRLVLEGVAEADLPTLTRQASLFGQRLCDGLIINHQMPPSEELRALAAASAVPVAWLNLRSEPGGIHPDDRAAGAAVAQALLGRGRRRLAWIDGSHDHTWASAIGGSHYSVAERLAGARAAAEAAGIPLRVVSLPFQQVSWEGCLAAVAGALSGPEAADGVVCYGDIDAQCVLEILARTGRRAGEAVGLVRFGADAALAGRPLATALVPLAEVGRQAVAAVVAAARAGTAVAGKAVPYTYDWKDTL